MLGDYSEFQRRYASKTTDVEILVGTQNYADAIVPKNTSHQLWIQKISLVIATHAAHTVSFVDTSSTTIKFGAHTDAVAGAGILDAIVYDFGPKGKPAGVGKNFSVLQDAAGIIGTVHIEAYERPISGLPASLQ